MPKQKKPTKFDDATEAANSVSALWMEFRKHLRKSFSSQEIQPEEEQRFLEVKSELSRLQRILAQKLPEGAQYGSKEITEVMSSSISIGTVRELPAADKKNLYQRWHECYIAMQRLLGTLDLLREGYPVQFQVHRTRSSNVKESIGMIQAKKGKWKKVVAAVAILAIAAIVYYLFFAQ